MAAAASSPTEWPAIGVPAGSSTRLRSSPNAIRLSATTSGWVIDVSWISSADAVLPSAARSSPIVSDHAATCSGTPGSSSHGLNMPGFWAPWPGARSAITVPE